MVMRFRCVNRCAKIKIKTKLFLINKLYNRLVKHLGTNLSIEEVYLEINYRAEHSLPSLILHFLLFYILYDYILYLYYLLF